MAEYKLLGDSARATVINTDATLADGAQASGDYDNSTELDVECDVYLVVQFVTTGPSERASIARLWVLPGDGEVTEVFPAGSASIQPGDNFEAGIIQGIDVSTSTDKVNGIGSVKLYPHTNRFVIRNISGQTFGASWELRIKPRKYQSA